MSCIVLCRYIPVPEAPQQSQYASWYKQTYPDKVRFRTRDIPGSDITTTRSLLYFDRTTLHCLCTLQVLGITSMSNDGLATVDNSGTVSQNLVFFIFLYFPNFAGSAVGDWGGQPGEESGGVEEDDRGGGRPHYDYR